MDDTTWKCSCCGTVLEPVFPGDQEFDGYQLNNALWIGFHGTYGMFIEEREAQYEDKPTDVLKHADKEAVLCHDCATRLCYEEPWLFDLLDPEHGHSHTLEYLAQHPNHRGWDAHREG